MALARFELKNEYGLGDPSLYQGALKEEDPRKILSGTSVSGLVGILRQLGDLAELAGATFYAVHQEVMTTVARGRKVLNRIQKIEAALPQLEKAVRDQKSHIHFAYVSGSDWHSNIKTGQPELCGSNLPEFMMDSYEECREPPHLHLLDKFDSAGAGACLNRYSDPSYFRILMAGSEFMAEKAHIGKELKRKKKERSRERDELVHHSINMTQFDRSNKPLSSLATDELSVSVDDASISDTLSISGVAEELTYISSLKRSDDASMSTELCNGDAEATPKADYVFDNDDQVTASDYATEDSLLEWKDPSLPSIGCGEKTVMVKFVDQMPFHDTPEDGLKPRKKAAVLNFALSNVNHLSDGFGMQREQISMSMAWDVSATDNLAEWVQTGSSSSSLSKENEIVESEMPSKLVSCEYSSASDEKTEILSSASFICPDDTTCRLPDSDSLLARLQTSNRHSEIDGTEMNYRENVLPDSMKMMIPSSSGDQICELESYLDEHMDSSKALKFSVQTNIEYRTEQGVIFLSDMKDNGMECKINGNLGVMAPTLDSVSSEQAHEDCTSMKKKISHAFVDHPQSLASIEFSPICSAENVVIERRTSDSTKDDDSERINSSGLGVIFPITYTSIVDGNKLEELSSQNSFCDTSAKTSSEKVEHCEHQTKQEAESTTNSNCRVTESRSSMEKAISTSKLDGPESETHTESFKITPWPQVIIPNTQVVVIDGVQLEFLTQNSSDNTGEREVPCERQIQQETDLTEDTNCQGSKNQCAIETMIAASKLDGPDSVTQTVVNDEVLPEESSSEDSFGDAATKHDAEKEVLCERQTKLGTELIDCSYYRTPEYQSSVEKAITASKSDGQDSETIATSCGFSDDYASPISTLSSDFTSSRSPVNTVSPKNDSEDSHYDISAQLTNTSVIFPSDFANIWTNGGLLGLKPSKPSDISLPNVGSSYDVCDGRLDENSQPFVLGSKNDLRKPLFKSDELYPKSLLDQDDSMLSKQQSNSSIQASSFCTLNKAQNAYFGNTISSEADIYSKIQPSRHSSIGLSVDFSSLAHRFLVNNLQRKSTAVVSPLSELMNNDAHKLFGTKLHSMDKRRLKPAISATPLHNLGNEEDPAHEFSDKLVSPSLDSSGHQSPPIKHMKASFQPMNDDSDAAKLRLEFLSSQHRGSMGDMMIHSFQLFTESFQPMPDDDLESDNDSFCRSCPYSSDDLLTLHSESDTDIWGEDEIEVSHRSEATGSISSSIEVNPCK